MVFIMESTQKILVVDDEAEIRNLLCILLKSSGYETVSAENGLTALDALTENDDIDLIILDIMMPKMSGTEACHEIRKISKAPVLFLTAKTREIDKSEAYFVGGDDFLAKPFSQGELMMKVNSLLRRYYVYKGKEETPAGGIINVGNLIIDTSTRRVKKSDELVDLTEKEYEILIFFINHKGIVVDSSSIYESVWQDKYLESSANTIMVHIVRLRKKIEDDPGNPQIIRTIYGKGYIFEH